MSGGFKEISPKAAAAKKGKAGPPRGKAQEPSKPAPGGGSALKRIFDPQSVSGLTLTLTLIALAVALLLGLVNQVTAPEIQRIAEEKAREAMAAVLPAHEYVQVEESGIHRAQDADGKLIGFVVQVTPVGYGGDIPMMVGVDLQPHVTGVSIISMSETPGFGSRALEGNFLSQFEGKSVSMKLGEDIDGISGATITTEAIVGGVHDALAAVLQYLAEEGGTGG